MQPNAKTLVIVTGPTASGKTSLAIELAKALGCDIISADSRQIFRDLPIGTAAPTKEERAAVPHHLIATHSLDQYYSAACFETDALALIHRQFEHSDYAVVCGGSMMYVDALTDGIDEMPTISEATRAYVLSLYENQGIEAVLAQLQILDPDYWEQVDRANTRRVLHGLEICLQAGVPYTSLRTGTKKSRPFRIVKLAIDRPRAELFERINARVDAMMEAGLLEEARSALCQGDYNSLNTVGYKELKAYFEGTFDLPTAVARIAKNTRVYAKKQLTWLARDPSIHWISPTSSLAEILAIIK